MPTIYNLPWPPSINHYWRRAKQGGMMISAEGKRYRADALAAVWSQGRKRHAGRLAVVIFVQPPNRIRRDIDNLLKAPLDALTHAGVWDDDEQIDDLRIVRGPRVKGGLMRVEIATL